MRWAGLAFIGIALAASCGQRETPAAIVPAKPMPIMVHVNAAGAILLDGLAVSRDDLEARFSAIAAMEPQPQVLISGEGTAPFADMAFVLETAQQTGVIRKMGVIGGT
jgi:biopolymer transport protein ExbD